ncbi:hypothetical protein FRC07_000468 [Ceratobasidium sp. 392]|nr:hypothetical protein FRC07_000468 [Ceratobasidium sp. 392]
MSNETTKRHARTRRGCLTCRIRKKGDYAKRYTTAIKCFLSEYPAAKAYSDPVPFLVLKTTPEVERWLAQDPTAFNPVRFDPETASRKDVHSVSFIMRRLLDFPSLVKPWAPSAPPPPPPSEPHGAAFPAATTSAEPAYAPGYPSPENVPQPHEPLTPSPEITYTYPSTSHYPMHLQQEAAPGTPWMYTTQELPQSFPVPPYVPSQQPVYDYSSQQGISTPNYYNPDGHTVHYVGPTILARQGRHALPPSKTGFDEAGAPVMWLF